MSATILSAVFLFGYFLSCHGWGRTAVRALGVAEASSVACNAAIGLSIWAFLGGLANLLEIATPPTLSVIYAFGLLLAVPSVLSGVRWTATMIGDRQLIFRTLLADRSKVLVIIPLSIALILLCAMLLPSFGFTPQDDFQSYMVRPVRMLDTGSMFGNPFDPLGLDSLGAVAFFHGFILLAFSVDYLNGFDTIICLGLSLFLLIDIGRRYEVRWPYIGFSILAFLSIHPQIVNIAALYSGTLMILVLVYLMSILADKFLNAPSEPVWREALLLGAALASLLALKNSFLIFAAVFLTAFFVLLMIVQPRRYRALLTAMVTAGSGLLLLSPWLLANLPTYFMWYQRVSAAAAHPSMPSGVDDGGALSASLIFSRRPLPWGGDFAAYLLVVALIVVVGILAILLMRRSTPGRVTSLLPVIAGSIAVVISYLSLGHIVSPYDSVRYATPILIAIWPVAGLTLVGQSSWIDQRVFRRVRSAKRTNVVGITIVALQILVVLPFVDTLLLRASHVINYRTMSTYRFNDEFVDNIVHSVGESRRTMMRNAQERTERDTTVLAWIGPPFHLDFARNKVLSIHAWGVASPWLDFPFDADIQRIHEYLATRQIRYLIWEYEIWWRYDEELYERYTHSDRWSRRIWAQRNLALNRLVPALAASRLKIYDDGHIVVVDLRAPPAAAGEENTVEPDLDAPD